MTKPLKNNDEEPGKIEDQDPGKSDDDCPSGKSSSNPPLLDRKSNKGLSTGAKVAIGVGTTVVGVGGAIIAAPALLAAAGFTSAGVAAGSLAASTMSWLGPIASGSIFASLQSAGAVGLGAAGLGAAGAAGAAAGGGLGAVIATLTKAEIPDETLRLTFHKHDTNSDGIITFEELRNVLKDLELTLSEEELLEAYKAATGNEKRGDIALKQFMKMFGVNI